MKTIKNIGLENVQAVYGGPEGDLWELVMGEQIHIGGFQSSMDLAKRAGIGPSMQGAGGALLKRRAPAKSTTSPHAPARAAESLQCDQDVRQQCALRPAKSASRHRSQIG